MQTLLSTRKFSALGLSSEEVMNADIGFIVESAKRKAAII
jgi:hypothetical protein